MVKCIVSKAAVIRLLTLLKWKSVYRIRPCTRGTKLQIFKAISQVHIYRKNICKVENDDETNILKMVQDQSKRNSKGGRFILVILNQFLSYITWN